VSFSTIPQPRFAVLAKTRRHTIAGGNTNPQDGHGGTHAASLPQIENDQIADADTGIAATTESLLHLLLDGPSRLGNNIGHGNSSCRTSWVLGFCFGIPIFHSHASKLQAIMRAAESCTV